MKFTAALTSRLADATAEAVRRNVEQRIGELQSIALLGAVVIENVLLPDSVPVMVAHKLGAAPRFVGCGIPRFKGGLVTSGTIVDFGATSQAGHPIDRSQAIQLGNFNFGQALTVDLFLVP